MKSNTVDILLATYNGEAFLGQQLQSLLDQSYDNIHIYIRDDGSTDNTLNIVGKFKERFPNTIKIVSGERKLGAPGNFGELLSCSVSEYVMFCDQDDVWLSNKVEETLLKMKQIELQYGPDTPILIHTDLQVVDHNLSLMAKSFWKYQKLNPRVTVFNRLIVQNVITGCTIMINRKLADACMPIPKDIIMHDWWIALVASAFGKIAYLDSATILYRQHRENTVGASKWGFLNISKKVILLMKNRILDLTQKQASMFLHNYKDKLSERQIRTLNAFILLGTGKRPIRDFHLFMQQRLFKIGLIRNIGMLCWLFLRRPMKKMTGQDRFYMTDF